MSNENEKLLLLFVIDALDDICDVADYINETIHEKENSHRVRTIQSALYQSQPHLLVPGRRFIKEGVLSKVSSYSPKMPKMTKNGFSRPWGSRNKGLGGWGVKKFFWAAA